MRYTPRNVAEFIFGPANKGHWPTYYGYNWPLGSRWLWERLPRFTELPDFFDPSTWDQPTLPGPENLPPFEPAPPPYPPREPTFEMQITPSVTIVKPGGTARFDVHLRGQAGRANNPIELEVVPTIFPSPGEAQLEMNDVPLGAGDLESVQLEVQTRENLPGGHYAVGVQATDHRGVLTNIRLELAGVFIYVLDLSPPRERDS